MPPNPTVTLRGTARNNYLYGTATHDGIDGGLGNDYLRGYAGFDYLWGGAGSDRFVFERTLAQNGVDTIKDYTYAPTATGGEVDVLDFSLVGFARNALSRNGGIDNGIDNVVRFVDDGIGGARVMVSLTGAGGETYTQWATLEGLYAGNLVHFSIGAHTYTRPVQGALSTGLRYDIGNGDRNGDGEPDAADNDDLFDDRLLVPYGEGDTRGAEVLIGDRVRGFGGTKAFTPGGPALAVPESVVWNGGESDSVHTGEFQVYYGTYDAATDIFTVTSTPGTTADPTSATHTMVLYDNNPIEGALFMGAWVFNGVFAESQWYIDNGALQYDMDGFFASQEMSVLNTENVLYGTSADESFDGKEGIDIIYAGAGNDRLFGGSTFMGSGNEEMTPPPDGNDWLYGGTGADIFFATNVLEGGIDTIKDFNGTNGDLMALADFPFPVGSALQSSDPLPDDPSWWSLTRARTEGLGGLYDIGTVAGASLEAALLAESALDGSINTQGAPFNVYRLQHNGKDYLFWDALGNGYTAGGDYDDTVVEITGAVNVNEGNIYLNLWQELGV